MQSFGQKDLRFHFTEGTVRNSQESPEITPRSSPLSFGDIRGN